MHMRRFAHAAVAAVGLAAMAATPAAAAGTKLIEPLNQYVVSGKVNPEDLARKGFDLTEAQVKGKPGFAIVATPSQAADLAGKDVTVRPLARERDDRQGGGAQPAHRPDARLRRLPALEPEAGAVPHHLRHAARAPQGLLRRPRAAQPRRGQEVRLRQEPCSARTSSPTR